MTTEPDDDARRKPPADPIPDLADDIARYRAMRDKERAQNHEEPNAAGVRPGSRRSLMQYLRARRGA